MPKHGTSGHIVEDEGTPVAQRPSLNFTGAGVSVADSGGKSVVTISGGAPAPGGGITYTYDDSSTTDADPGAGNLRFDDADPLGASFIYVDDADSDGNDRSGHIASWEFGFVGDSGGSIIGLLRVTDAADPANFALYMVSDIIDASGYTKIAVLPFSSGGTVAAGDVTLDMDSAVRGWDPIVGTDDPSGAFPMRTGQLWYDTDDTSGVTASGGLLQMDLVTATGNSTYNVPAGANKLVVECIGGGGAGGSADGGSSQAGMGGGGGGGGYCMKEYAVAGGEAIGVTVDPGGTPGGAGNNAGGNGGVTEFDTAAALATKMSAKGGTGGPSVGAAGTSVLFVMGGAGAAVATGGDYNAGGQPGGEGHRLSGTAGRSGSGGPGPKGGGGGIGQNIGSAVGNAATTYGAGGGGAISNNTTDRAGGAGSQGVIVVWVYA